MKNAFDSIKIGSTTLPNRFVMGSMHLGIEGKKGVAERMAAFYDRRFAGEVGMIVTGGISVNEEGKGSKGFFSFSDTEHREEMKKMVQGIKNEGIFCAQLFHAGRYAYSRDCVAPSAIRAPINRFVPKELSEEECWTTIKDFGKAASYANEIGFKAVEVMGSEGYLINQFCSPVTNKREDFFGGTPEKRTNFAVEVLKEIKNNLPEGFPIIYRISGIDLIPDSSTFEDVILLAQRLEKEGVSALNIGIGWHESRVPTISQLVPRGAWAGIAGKVKKEIKSIPIIASNRINMPETAQKVLDSEEADLISMARPFLADADIVKKIKISEHQKINTCIACNQACLDHAFLEKDVSCVVNPRAVRELDYPVDKRDSKRVVVIGSGPAGLEAARAAAEIGHKVILIEKDSEIGGQLIMAAKIPGKFEFLETIRYYKNELKDLNVDIRLNTECTLDLLKELNSDAIIFATGVKPREVNIDGLEKVHHVTYSDFLKGKNKVGEKVVIIGGGGIAVDIAHLLTAHGEDLESYFKRYKIDTYNKIGIEKQSSSKDITIFKRSGKVGAGLGQTTFWALKQELENTGVKFITGLKYKEVKESNLVYEDNKSGELNSTVVDTIILCAGQESENKLAEECKNVMPDKKVIVVGGAKNSSGIDAKRAFQEGLDAAYSI